MRLIDADALQAVFRKKCQTACSCCSYFKPKTLSCGLIDNTPTVDTTFRELVVYECGQKSVEERPKGKWIGDTDYESCQGNYEAYKCSECGYGIDWRKHHQLMCQDKIPEEYREYYCPHCGARME